VKTTNLPSVFFVVVPDTVIDLFFLTSLRLMNFISAVFILLISFVLMSRFHSRIKSDRKAKILSTLIEIVFGQSLILKHGSEFTKFVNV